MANLNIKFNNKTYSIDSALLADTLASLEGHLVAMMDEPVGEKKFKTILYYPDIGAVDFCEFAASEGLLVVNVAVLPTKTTDGIMLSDYDCEYLYYIEDENDICIYSGSKSAYGCEGWLSRSLHLGIPFNGTITDTSEATQDGLYALIYYDVAL